MKVPLSRTVGYASAAFGLQVFWATYVAFLPPLLERLGASPLGIGAVMACDPAAMIVIMPLAGLASDRLQTPLGGRLPFMIASALAAALTMIALGHATGVAEAAGLATCVCVATSTYWAPYRAILADAFLPEAQAMTSGIQSLARELGTLALFMLGASSVGLAARAFDFASAALLATTLWCCLALGRPASRAPFSAVLSASAASVRGELSALPRRLVAAQLLWWFALEAVTGFAVLFIAHDILGIHDLASSAGHVATTTAIGVLAVLAFSGVAASIPVAMVAQRLGKLPVVRFGLAALLAAMGLAMGATSLSAVYGVAVLFGLGLAILQVLAFPLLLELRPQGGGALASVYSLLIAIPQLLALVSVGALAQATGTYRSAFAIGAVALAGALFLMRSQTVPVVQSGTASVTVLER